MKYYSKEYEAQLAELASTLVTPERYQSLGDVTALVMHDIQLELPYDNVVPLFPRLPEGA